MAEVLVKACVDLGISFTYKGHTITASSPAVPVRGEAPTQLEFFFDAEYFSSNESNSWRMTQRKAEPLEFNLRIKIAG